MILNEMIVSVWPNINDRVEIRDEDNNEILTCAVSSAGLAFYGECEVLTWFPHGAPGKDATFTIRIDTSRAIKKGEWIEGKNGNIKCNRCGAEIRYAYLADNKPDFPKFCCDCGAKMEVKNAGVL